MRVLALDYGSARCGCALSDPTGTIVTPIAAVPSPGTRRGLRTLSELVRDREVERVVVGLPLSLGGGDTEQTRETRAFAQRLSLRLGDAVPVEMHDELAPVIPATEFLALPEPAPAPTPQPKHAEPVAATPSTGDDATLTALLQGLGIDAGTVRHIPADDLARLVGGMLRVATQGTMTALRSRSMAKRETRIAMTLIEERDNNPLKFFPDVDMALTQMLGARGAGYLAPEDALQEAFHDIQTHELAVVAGMRAALEHAMSRIDPVTIDRSVQPAKGIDALLGNRRARLWQRFVDTWEDVARDAGDDFQRTFGEPFSRAYQAQLDALTRSTPSD